MKQLFVLFLFGVASSHAAGTAFSISSDPAGHYHVLEKSGPKTARLMIVRRLGQEGASYSRLLYDCTRDTVQHLAQGKDLADIVVATRSGQVTSLVKGSTDYYIGVEACKTDVTSNPTGSDSDSSNHQPLHGTP